MKYQFYSIFSYTPNLKFLVGMGIDIRQAIKNWIINL